MASSARWNGHVGGRQFFRFRAKIEMIVLCGKKDAGFRFVINLDL
jgi:hypothetical protein